MGLFESSEERALRAKIRAEEMEKFAKEQTVLKEEKIRKQEAAKIRNGGLSGIMISEIKKFLKDDKK